MKTESKVYSWLPLILISCLGLFLELAVIRWLSAELRLFAYIKNFPLLASFLGLAIGFAIAGRGKDYKPALAPLLFIFIILTLVMSYVGAQRAIIYPSGDEEFVWFSTSVSYWLDLALFFTIVLIFFLLNMFLFVPIGQATGEEMNRHKPVQAYIVNIASSLVGIWSFTLLSFLETKPLVWFGVAIVAILIFYYMKRSISWKDILLYTAAILAIVLFNKPAVWSPYQRLTIEDVFTTGKDGTPVRLGYYLDVQHIFFQTALDLSDEFVDEQKANNPDLPELAGYYNLPYKLVDDSARILVVGAGMGNDVAAALRNQALHVDAVEIDPSILDLGYLLHPERPYHNPIVTAIADDARSYFERTSDKYDIIAFGLLDSHSLLSGWTSVRLDSFIYTQDSFEEVREHLSKGGILSLAHAAGLPWIDERLGRMLQAVFGEDKVYYAHKDMGTTFVGSLFVAGDVEPGRLEAHGLAPFVPNPQWDDLPLASDDWPYLYMRDRIIPKAYWQTLLLICLVTLAILARSFPEVLRPDWHFWLLGAAFLLIEFTSITRLALLFGTTWLVNALAISGVLLMVLFANLIVLWRQKLNIRLVYVLLFASLILVIVFPLEVLNQLPPVWRGVSSMLLLSLPLFFSGMIFSEAMRRIGNASTALASNLSGSVFGGVMEYTSLLWGVHSLYLSGIVIYGLAFLAFLRRR